MRLQHRQLRPLQDVPQRFRLSVQRLQIMQHPVWLTVMKLRAETLQAALIFTPIEAQIELLQKVLPEAKTIGILYCSAESNSEIQLQMTKEVCAEKELDVVEFSVASSNEIQSVVESAVGKVDALYSFTDNTIAAGMNTVAMVANENNLPVVCGEQGMVEAGGLCTYSIDYYELGYLAGQMAVKILKGEAEPATMPIEYYPSDKCEFIGNDATAETLGIDLSVAE